MTNWRPVDWIVMLMTICIVYAVFVMGIPDEWLGRESNPQKPALVAEFLKALQSMIAVYVGAMIQKKADDRKP